MRKMLVGAVLLAAGLSSAQAEETTWRFTYQGFFDVAAGVFDPRIKLQGSFTGEDTNGDGIIGRQELSSFIQGDTEFMPIEWGELGNCGTSYLHCEIDSFSYKLTGKLAYAVRTWGGDEGNASWYSSTVTGGSMIRTRHSDREDSETRFDWWDDTRFTISPAPVPEPTTALMLPAGLALIYLMRARRRSNPR